MKKMLLTLAVILMLVAVPVFADGQENNATENDNATPLLISEKIKDRIETVQELRDSIAAKREELKSEISDLKAEIKQMRENQNRVRLAVHALLSMENLTGGIGKNVSAIARNFNNSIQTREQLEDRIQNRNFVLKTLFGDDEAAAKELAAEMNISDEKLQELRALKEQCNCSAEVKTEIQAQIQELEQEQLRLRNLSEAAIKNRGWLGWIWK